MNHVRFTIKGDEGTHYSWVETDEHWEPEVFQERYGVSQVFPTPEACDHPESPIYGVLESLGQSEDCPPFLWREAIVWASIEWLGEENE